MSRPAADAQDPNEHRIEHELRGMIATLTRHLAALGKRSGSRYQAHTEEVTAESGGARMVTLAGENKGATMRAAGWDEALDDDTLGMLFGGEERLGAVANSNYQAANNSILLGGSCTAEDPGVHIVISDYVEEEEEEGEDEEEEQDEKHEQKKKKKKKDKEKEKKKKKDKEKKKEKSKGGDGEEDEKKAAGSESE